MGHMLGICWLSWAYVGDMLAYVGPMLAYVGPMLSHLGGHVGQMLGICWLSWAYVKSSVTFFDDFSFPQSKNHGKTYVFRHRQDEILARQGAQNPVKHSVFYTSHTRNTVNYRGFSEPEVTRESARFGTEGRRQGARPSITFGYHRRPSGQGTGFVAGARI